MLINDNFWSRVSKEENNLTKKEKEELTKNKTNNTSLKCNLL